MTTSGNVPELPDLEPLDDGAAPAEAPAAAAQQASIAEASLQALRAGLPAPAFNPRCTDKAYYRLLMCSVLMLLGCLMPFSADLQQTGYKTVSGALFTFISLGMLWTWWAAIHNNRSTSASLKWLALCFLPLLVQVMNLINYQPVVALDAAKAAGILPASAAISTWDSLFGDMGAVISKSLEAEVAALKVENFFRCFGTGRFLLLIGAALAEVFFVLGIAGGAKQNKQQSMARMAQAAQRKRR